MHVSAQTRIGFGGTSGGAGDLLATPLSSPTGPLALVRPSLRQRSSSLWGGQGTEEGACNGAASSASRPPTLASATLGRGEVGRARGSNSVFVWPSVPTRRTTLGHEISSGGPFLDHCGLDCRHLRRPFAPSKQPTPPLLSAAHSPLAWRQECHSRRGADSVSDGPPTAVPCP